MVCELRHVKNARRESSTCQVDGSCGAPTSTQLFFDRLNFPLDDKHADIFMLPEGKTLVSVPFSFHRTECKAGRCVGYNERKNIFNAARHFTTFLLPHGEPETLKQQIHVMTAAYSNATMSAQQLLDHLNTVIEEFKSGHYLHREVTKPVASKRARTDDVVFSFVANNFVRSLKLTHFAVFEEVHSSSGNCNRWISFQSIKCTSRRICPGCSTTGVAIRWRAEPVLCQCLTSWKRKNCVTEILTVAPSCCRRTGRGQVR